MGKTRLCVFLCVLSLLTLCACSYAKPVDPVFAFEARTKVTIGEKQYACSLTRSAPQSARLTVSEPKELDGMTWFWSAGGFSVTYAGLTIDPEQCVLPDGSFIPLILKALDAACVEDALTTSGDGVFFGSVGGENFTLTADRSSGRILELEIPGKGLRVEFEVQA